MNKKKLLKHIVVGDGAPLVTVADLGLVAASRAGGRALDAVLSQRQSRRMRRYLGITALVAATTVYVPVLVTSILAIAGKGGRR